MIVVHLLTNAVTKALEFTKSEHVIHQHIVLLKYVFDDELEKWVHVVVLRVVFVAMEKTDWFLLRLWGAFAYLIIFGFVRGCSQKATGRSRNNDVGASL